MVSGWNDVPGVTEPLGPLGLALWGLALLSALLVSWVLAGMADRSGWRDLSWMAGVGGAFVALFPFIRFLRAVDSGDRFASAAVWIFLLALVLGLAVVLLRAGLGSAAVGWGTAMGVALGMAAIWDLVNEKLAHIPMSWAGVVGFVAIVIVCVVAANDQR